LETGLKISLFVINGKDWRSEVQRYPTEFGNLWRAGACLNIYIEN